MLQDLIIEKEYRSDTIPPLAFYINCLENSCRFDRAAGYFSSSGLSEASKGFAHFIHNDGYIRLVVSPDFEPEDYELLNSKISDRAKIIEEKLLNSIQSIDKQIQKDRIGMLAWLLNNGRLEIKIAIKKTKNGKFAHGIYHEKMGIFYDNVDTIAFSGSSNESRGGFISNFESIDVYKSWNGYEIDRIELKAKHFGNLWNNSTNYLEVFDLPAAVKNNLIKKRKRTVVDPEENDLPSNILSKNPKPHFPTEYDILDYQTNAVQSWIKNGYQGLFEMATGTGKTVTALRAASELISKNDKIITIILVPSVSLVEQWEKDCIKFSFNTILKVYKDTKNWYTKYQSILNSYKLGSIKYPVIISTYTSYQLPRFQQMLSQIPSDSLIICDEVHNFGASESKKYLPHKLKYRLGLSATPHRHFDELGTNELLSFFKSEKSSTFKLDIRDAIDMGALCEYYLHIHEVNLNDDEYQKYIAITKKIGQRYAINKGKFDKYDKNLEMLLIKRKRIINNASHKKQIVEEIIKNRIIKDKSIKYMLIYCPEGKDENDTTLIYDYGRMLGNDLGIKIKYFIGNTDAKERKLILEGFADGKIEAILAMKCLDEGIDVKRTETAILVASSTNPRQYIQRRGRVLRKHPEKNFAIIHDLFVLPPSLDTDYDDDTKSSNINKNIIEQELRRLFEFAKSSLNYSDSMMTIRSYCTDYGIDINDW